MTIHVTRDIIFDIFARSGELMSPAEIETALNRLLPKMARRSGESIAPWGRWTVMKFIRELGADGVIEKQRVNEDGFQMDLFRVASVRESSFCKTAEASPA